MFLCFWICVSSVYADNYVTRGEFLKALVSNRGMPLWEGKGKTFLDIPQGHPLYKYAKTALAYRLIPQWSGYYNPGLLISNAEAIYYILYSLGLSKEIDLFANILRLKKSELNKRGLSSLNIPLIYLSSAIIAKDTKPSLTDKSFLFKDLRLPLSKRMFLKLIARYKFALKNGLVWDYEISLKPGLSLRLHREGVLKKPPLWIIQFAIKKDKLSAYSLLNLLKVYGFRGFVELIDNLYRVRIGPFKSFTEALDEAFDLKRKGLSYLALSRLDKSLKEGPLYWACLIVSPDKFNLLTALCGSSITETSTVSKAALKHNAIAAVNGGFFYSSGDPVGLLMIDGKVLSEPSFKRTCLGWNKTMNIIVSGKPSWYGYVVLLNGRKIRLDGINRKPRKNEVILFTPDFGKRCVSGKNMLEIVIRGQKVVFVRKGRNGYIPKDGFVLVLSGLKRSIVKVLSKGKRVKLNIGLFDLKDKRWGSVEYALQGGPCIIKGDMVYNVNEGFSPYLLYLKHPRTAVGIDHNGRFIFLVVDGRDPYHSIGVSIYDLAKLMKDLGSIWALNLDGGGSSTLYANGFVWNSPSDGKERKISYAILIK